ncbi:MAG: hypothetical protein A3F46_04155 [Legionellales bacterium RIFCSPHIGHO2_12_FULL_42_9]|nr:MAG: hypothetical protein A3F46_04155 [Legionellales bacterium RIFCSPHIGHO2_12_FULL_42_9]
MERKKDRVMAYALAKEVSSEALACIAGGKGNASQVCMHQTAHVSGTDLCSVDFSADFRVDW